MKDYRGRIPGIGLPQPGKPGGGYAASGRSPPSNEREAVPYREEHRVAIEPLNKEEMEKDPNRFYKAAVKWDPKTGLLVVSNGNHTDDIFDTYTKIINFGSALDHSALQDILDDRGPEDDPFYTPRVAGVIYPAISAFYLGIVVPKNRGERYPWTSKACQIQPAEGELFCITTYNGQQDETGPMPFDIDGFPDNLSKIMLPYPSSNKLSKDFMDNFNPSLIAASIGFLYNPETQSWETETTNKWIKQNGIWVAQW